MKANGDSGIPPVTITFANGKTGEFYLAVKGSFKGETDFGEVELQPPEDFVQLAPIRI